jgi:hypothetical protein
MRYIELNPVRAGMVADPTDYPWSSYPSNALGQPDDLVVPHLEYQRLGASDESRQLAYRALFNINFLNSSSATSGKQPINLGYWAMTTLSNAYKTS